MHTIPTDAVPIATTKGAVMANPIDDHDAIASVIQLYVDGTTKGDIAKLKKAFHEDSRMFGELDGVRADVTITTLFDLVAEGPTDVDGTYRGRIIRVDQAGDAAVAVLTEDGLWGAVSCVDFFSLARIDGTWKIVNKTFAQTGGRMLAH